MSDIDGKQEAGQAQEPSLEMAMRQLQVDGGGPAGSKVEALLFATLGDLTDVYALDQTDLEDLGRMFGVITSDVKRGVQRTSKELGAPFNVLEQVHAVLERESAQAKQARSSH